MGLELKKGLGQMSPDGRSRAKAEDRSDPGSGHALMGGVGKPARRGENAGRPVGTSWGQEGKEGGAVSERCMARAAKCPMHTTSGNAEHGKSLESLCLCPLCQEVERHDSSWTGRRESSAWPSPAWGWGLLTDLQGEDLLKVSFPRVHGPGIVALCRR